MNYFCISIAYVLKILIDYRIDKISDIMLSIISMEECVMESALKILTFGAILLYLILAAKKRESKRLAIEERIRTEKENEHKKKTKEENEKKNRAVEAKESEKINAQEIETIEKNFEGYDKEIEVNFIIEEFKIKMDNYYSHKIEKKEVYRHIYDSAQRFKSLKVVNYIVDKHNFYEKMKNNSWYTPVYLNEVNYRYNLIRAQIQCYESMLKYIDTESIESYTIANKLLEGLDEPINILLQQAEMIPTVHLNSLVQEYTSNVESKL